MPASWVDIKVDGGPMEGYLTQPEESGEYPAVVVIQEIWGVNSHIQSVVDRLLARTTIKGTSSSRRRLAAVTVLAICISDKTPSWIRTPPPETTATAGMPRRAAFSKAMDTFSPTTLPMVPPMNPKSNTMSIVSTSPIRHFPATAASVRPVRFWSCSRNFRYRFRRENERGSTVFTYL